MKNRLIEIIQELKNREYADEGYKAISNELRIYCATIMQLSREKAQTLVNKYINKDKKAFDNFFKQYPHGLINLTQLLIDKLTEQLFMIKN